MTQKELKEHIFIGVVEDNQDPKKLGRCKCRVLNIFDDIPVEDIPWATPWKDLNGNQFILPEVGKVLSIVFDEGNIYKPEYIFAEHYNINLERKLNSLSGQNYTSMRSLMFDHKTQIYSNDGEGLKLDYKFNNINITEGSINLNLKDNEGLVNIGDATAGQQAILGNHFLNWFDKFLNTVVLNGHLGNLAAPLVPTPDMLNILTEYYSLRDPKFLSHHVNIVDNSMVSTVGMSSRENDGQLGDTWKSTVTDNTKTSKESTNYTPQDGPKKEYESNYTPPSTNGDGDNNLSENKVPPATPLSNPASNPEINRLIRFLQYKGYEVYDKPHVLNIVGMRTKDEGRVTNKFDDVMRVFYKNSNGNWMLTEYQITTTPGFKPKTTTLPDRVAIMQLGQYPDEYKIGYHAEKIYGKTHRCLKFATTIHHRNDNPSTYNYRSKTQEGAVGLNIHRSSTTGSSENVFNWSEGCQVFKNINQYNQFMQLVDEQVEKSGKQKFTYTLVRKSEFDSFT